MSDITFHPIGYVHSPYASPSEAPPQSVLRDGVRATIEILPEFVEGLANLAEKDYIVVLFNFHLSQGYTLSTLTPWSEEKRGVFSTRSPHRPNPIGMTITRLLDITDNVLTIEGVDMVDGTPVLDIKGWYSKLVPEPAFEGQDSKEEWPLRRVRGTAQPEDAEAPA